MALSGLDIYKLLPKTNCRECGFATCLAFAMQLAKKSISIEKCPYLSPESKVRLEASSLPPIRLITVGEGESKLQIGNETVLFRHEEKFHHPCGIGFILKDSLSDEELKKKVALINNFQLERVGQHLSVDLIALKQEKAKSRFIDALKIVLANTKLNLVLMSQDPVALKEALVLSSGRRPLVYKITKENLSSLLPVIKEFKVPVVAESNDISSLSELTQTLAKEGIEEIVVDTGLKPVAQKILDLTQVRSLSLKKSQRSLGYPFLTITSESDNYAQTEEAATYISKYAGIVLLNHFDPACVLSLLTLRQNIYTDPQKPLQIEPKLYPIGKTDKNSPLLVTTNFSLSYYTVLGEVEASKIPSYILSVDTEGMSVLTAWAAEKFNAEKITEAMKKFEVEASVSKKSIIIPGYLAVMSGDLQEQSGWEVIVGPKEAAGIPSFLKNIN